MKWFKPLDEVWLEEFKKDIYIETWEPENPLVMHVDENTWTMVIHAKTSGKILEVMMQTTEWEMKIKIDDILLEN